MSLAKDASAARNLSIALILLSAYSAHLAVEQWSLLESVREARLAMVKWHIASRIMREYDPEMLSYDVDRLTADTVIGKHFDGLTCSYQSVGRVRAAYFDDNLKWRVEVSPLPEKDVIILGRVVRPIEWTAYYPVDWDQTYWGTLVLEDANEHKNAREAQTQPKASKLLPVLDEFRGFQQRHILELSSELGIANSSSMTASEAYQRIERHYWGRSIQVPALGIRVEPTTAFWLLAIICLASVISLRAHTRVLSRNAISRADEPWIIIHAETASERVLRYLWLWAMFLAPLICISGPVLQVLADLELSGPGTLTQFRAYSTSGSLIVLSIGALLAWSARKDLLLCTSTDPAEPADSDVAPKDPADAEGKTETTDETQIQPAQPTNSEPEN